MRLHDRDPILLTPGPLTTSTATKLAMLRDWGSWDAGFNADHRARARAGCCDIVTAEDTHVCVPLQGSGTFAVEATLGTLVPRDGHVLVPHQRRLLQAHRAHLRDAGPQGSRPSSPPRTQPSTAADVDAAARARPVDHARRAGALRDQHRHPESAARRSPRSSRATARA